ncbi:hypothetical protein BLOT_015642 [Blomia tropicalis]|nr:hypothetical protein BLOT_015642 [Blomia tropicalis]
MSEEEEKTGGSGSGTFGGSNSSIAALSFKAPKFDKKYVKMWLELVEAGFITSNYTRPETKFAHTLQLMQPDQLVFVSDALASKDYETLKTAIIKAFCPSAASQRQKFHAPIELGNRSPRELFVEIRSIGNDIGCTAAAIRRRWLDALPTTYQNALVTHEDDNDDGMVEWAERIHQNMLNENVDGENGDGENGDGENGDGETGDGEDVNGKDVRLMLMNHHKISITTMK